MNYPRRQQGMSMFSIIFLLMFLAVVGTVGFRLMPIYADYFTVLSIAKEINSDTGLMSGGSHDIVRKANNLFQMNNMYDLKPNVIKVKKSKSAPTGKAIVIDYEVRRHIIANLDVVASFNRTIGE